MGLFDTQNGQAAGNRFGSDSEAAGARGNLNAAQTQARAIADNPQFAGQSVQGDPILGQLFGKGGTLDQSVGQEKDLANRGYSLQPEDYEAYGQASGNIARMFGGQEQGLAQDLASRGISNSGAAGAAFSNMYGNKQEQLGGLQTQIAQNRMQMNQSRLKDMQNFVSTLGGQAQGAEQGAFGRAMQANQNSYNQASGVLGNIQGQENEQIQQQNSGSHSSADLAGVNAATGLFTNAASVSKLQKGQSPLSGSTQGPTQSDNSGGTGAASLTKFLSV